MLFGSVIFCLVAGSFAVSVKPGPCPNVTVVDLNLVGLSGRWYKYASTENEYDETQKCMTHYWSYPKHGVTTVVSTSISTKTGNPLQIESQVTINKKDASLNVVSAVPLLGEKFNRYWDTKTVYDSYAISWACENQGPNHVQSVAIYTRERNPKVNVMQIAREVNAKNGISIPDLRKFNHNHCY